MERMKASGELYRALDIIGPFFYPVFFTFDRRLGEHSKRT